MQDLSVWNFMTLELMSKSGKTKNNSFFNFWKSWLLYYCNAVHGFQQKRIKTKERSSQMKDREELTKGYSVFTSHGCSNQKAILQLRLRCALSFIA